MYDKKLTVAVIDGGVDVDNNFFRNKDLKSITIDELNNITTDNLYNHHATSVCSYIYKECEDINLISIKALDSQNKCSLKLLIKAIKHCIDLNVDIINLSLGICIDIKQTKELKEICYKAMQSGIIIFSAHNNDQKVAYPASFTNIIGINYDKSIKNKFLVVDKENRDIIFSIPLISSTHLREKGCNNGNSYLCPYIVGLFISYIKYHNLDIKSPEITKNFLEFMDYISSEYSYSIFNRVTESDKNKQAIFYPLNDKNENIINAYNHMFNITSYLKNDSDEILSIENIKEDVFSIERDFDKVIQDTELFIIGEIDYIDDLKKIEEVISLLKVHKKDILIRYGFINTFNRYIYSKETGCKIMCQHL